MRDAAHPGIRPFMHIKSRPPALGILDGTSRVTAAPSHRMACSEVWGANSNVAHSVWLPGLEGWVYSAPIELGHPGGDTHYFSVCGQDVLSRVALADVSGHGRAVSEIADRLLNLMRGYIDRVEQRAFLAELSGSLLAMHSAEQVPFATALLVGFDSSTGQLLYTNAGHPPPLRYRSGAGHWEWLGPVAPARTAEPPSGLPLGMTMSSEYEDFASFFAPGDLLVCYTDGLSEATNDRGEELGLSGLLELAARLPTSSPKAAGARLIGLVEEFRNGAPSTDDETVIVLRRRG